MSRVMLKQSPQNVFRLSDINVACSTAFDPVNIEGHSLRGGADVRHNGDSRALQLGADSKIAAQRLASRELIDFGHQFPRMLPTIQVFKCHGVHR